jgi:hypothetical protein
MAFFQTKTRHFWTTPWDYPTKFSPIIAFFKTIQMICSNFFGKKGFCEKMVKVSF